MKFLEKHLLLLFLIANATAEYVTVGGDAGANIAWNGGGFSDIDTSGQIMSYHGGSGDTLSASSGLPTPVGGALGSRDMGSNWDSGTDNSVNQQMVTNKPILGSKLFGRKTEQKQQKNSSIDFNGLTLENNEMDGDKYFVKGSDISE